MRSRDAILEGAQAAARLHDQLGVQAAIESTCGRVDVFGALLASNAALIFRPLEGLLGALHQGSGCPRRHHFNSTSAENSAVHWCP